MVKNELLIKKCQTSSIYEILPRHKMLLRGCLTQSLSIIGDITTLYPLTVVWYKEVWILKNLKTEQYFILQKSQTKQDYHTSVYTG